jgi:integrase
MACARSGCIALRHTTATLLKDLGVPPRDTMEILGHARIAVTMEIYTGADDVSRRMALTKLDTLFEWPDRDPKIWL